jgi:hypothetical protein
MDGITTLRSILLPNLLRKGDVITLDTGGVLRDVRLTEAPQYGVLVFAGVDCPVYHLTGTDLSNGREFKVTRSARLPVDTTRELRLSGGRAVPLHLRTDVPDFTH